MKRTRVVEFLSKLSPAELKRLKKFVDSDYFNPSSRTKELFKILEKAYPEFDEYKINSEKVFKAVFGLKKQNLALLRNVTSDLMKICEEFILNEQITEQSFVRQQLLYDYHFSKGNLSLAEYVLNDRLNELKKKTEFDHNYFLYRFMSTHSVLNLAFNTQYRGNLNKLYQKHDIGDLANKLDDYYLYEFATLTAEMVNSYRAHNKQFDSASFLRNIEHYLHKSEALHPLVLFRLKFCKMLLAGNEELYEEVKVAFKEFHKQLDTAMKTTALVNLHGFAASRAWQGSKYFLNEMEEWTLLREKLDLLLDDGGKINPIAFWNIAQLKLTKGNKRNAVAFIKKYSKHLPEPLKEDTLKLVTAAVRIYEKQFDQAIAQLLTIYKPFFASDIIHRRMLLKCYFETSQWDLLVALLDASDKFLRNNSAQFPEQIKSAFKAFLETIRLLVKAQTIERKANKAKLIEKIAKTTLVLEEVWFREKIEQL